MTPFELVEPKTLKEAAGLLDPDDPTIRPLGGGTALMLMMKAAIKPPSMLPSPPKTQMIKVIGPKVRPTNGCTSYCRTRRQAASPARPPPTNEVTQ